MKLSFSVGARGRVFAKAMRRIRPDFSILLEKFDQVRLDGPTPAAILIGIMDELPDGAHEEVPNSGGFFQETVGCHPKDSDEELRCIVFNLLRDSVKRCPLSEMDRNKLDAVFQEFASNFCYEYKKQGRQKETKII